MTILLLDYYSGNRQPNFDVFTAAGFRAGFRKFSMQLGPDGEINIDLAAQKKAGWGIGGYHWCDPSPSATQWPIQADHFQRQIDLYDPAVLMLDEEQYWMKWSEYWAGKVVAKAPPTRIRDNAATIHEIVQRRNAPKPILNYTARWFTISYCPILGPWIGDKPACIADYYFYGKNTGIMQIDAEGLADLIPDVLADPIATPTGVTNIVMRQFESRLWLDGTAHNYDMNVWLKDDALFYEWFRMGPPPPTLEERVTSLENRVSAIENAAAEEENELLNTIR
jgi:hypothetical protein